MALTQISTDGVKNDAISHNKIPANAIQASELADNAVDTAAIAADAVTGAKIADESINSEHFVDGSIDAIHLASNSVLTAKIGNDEVTTAKLADDAVTNAKVADDAIGVAQLSASGTASSSTFLRGDNSWTTVNTDLVADTSPQLGGNLDTNSHEIFLDDSHAVVFGDGNDLRILHDGTDNVITSDGAQAIRLVNHLTGGNESMIKCIPNGSTELYHNGTKKLETTADGVKVSGDIRFDSPPAKAMSFPDNKRIYFGDGDDFWIGSNGSNGEVSGSLWYYNHQNYYDNVYLRLGNGNDLTIYHDGSNSKITNSTGYLLVHSVGGDSVIRSDNGVLLQPAGGENGVSALANGAVELYYNNSKKLETTSAGGTLTGTWTGAGKILQVIEARKTDKFNTQSTSFVDVPSLTVNITPSSSSNKILVRAVVSTGMGNGGLDGFLRLLRGSTAIKLDQCTRMGSSEQNETIVLERLDTPNTTSQVTYKIQGKTSSNELFVNRDGSNDGLGESTIIVMEVAG